MSSSSQGSLEAGEVHEPAETADLMQDFRGTAYCVGDDRHSDRQQHPPEARSHSGRRTAAARVGRAGARRRSQTATVTGCRRRRDVGDRDGMDVLTR